LSKSDSKKEILSIDDLQRRRLDVLDQMREEVELYAFDLDFAKENLATQEALFSKLWYDYKDNIVDDPAIKEKFYLYCDNLSNLIDKVRFEKKELEKIQSPFIEKILSLNKCISRLTRVQSKKERTTK